MFSSQNSQVSNDVNYIEDVFSTYLYTGNGSTQTITNGIDLAGKGGLVWQKERDSTGNNHALMDTLNGGGNFLQSNDTNALATGYIGSFTSSGFTTGTFSGNINNSAKSEVSWTFRKQPKFFDVVTYTGTGAGNTITHNLGSKPGCIIIKRTDSTGDWFVVSRKADNDYVLFSNTGTGLNNTAAANSSTAGGDFSATTINIGALNSSNNINASGGTYVAYLFAHDAGGFGLTGTDNVISCGSFTTDGTGAAGNITLGYEAQWVLIKRSDGTGGWNIIDTMRGSSLTSYNYLSPNTSGVESSSTSAGQGIFPTATGFFVGTNFPAASANYIYIAIRRGPMKVPTLGTSVFEPQTWTGTGTDSRVFTGFNFPLDLLMLGSRDAVQFASYWLTDRLQGASQHLQTASTSAVFNTVSFFTSALDRINGYVGGLVDSNQINTSGALRVQYGFRRAPGFFDEVCYTGTGVAGQTYTHNLSVVPELMIVKGRSIAEEWNVYYGVNTKYLKLNSTDIAQTATTRWNDTSPTSSVFTVGTSGWVNQSGSTYVAYLFATATGVSKVGSYTGTGALQTVACGFTSGARFVLVKRVDSTGDWYVWDSARGITSGNDPYLLLNSTAAEVTSTNYVDTDTTGFKVTAAAPAALNASGGTYIFLAIA